MSDFIYSNKQLDLTMLESRVKQQLDSISSKKIYKYRGAWGSLLITENHYNGFLPYENDQYIVVVVGGPVLYFHDNSFINRPGSNEGTKVILNRWIEAKIRWDEDLSGPFVILIIDKEIRKCHCFTDHLMSFIPVFKYVDTSIVSLSTHIGILAHSVKSAAEIDLISAADFILQGVVTFPYTIFNKIYQIEPVSIHTINVINNSYHSTYYWIPKEENLKGRDNCIDEEVRYIQQGLDAYINKVAKHSRKIAQFISGGEDSRLLSSLLSRYRRDAFIFFENMNVEVEIAKKIAKIFNAKITLVRRDKLHYLNILPNAVDLLGGGFEHYHAHSLKLWERCNLHHYDAVFGGLFSDALLKGARINKIRGTGSYPFIPQVKIPNNKIIKNLQSDIFDKCVINEIKKRRSERLDYTKSIREESFEEWFYLWPSTMNKNIPNLHINRRLFNSYEPFMTKEVVKSSARIPQKLKLNRRLFQQVAKTYLNSSKWVLSGDGRLPYFSWKVNIFISSFVILYRIVEKKLGFIKGSQNTWANWNEILNSSSWDETVEYYTDQFELISSIFNNKTLNDLMYNKGLSNIEKLNTLQTMYLISNYNS